MTEEEGKVYDEVMRSLSGWDVFTIEKVLGRTAMHRLNAWKGEVLVKWLEGKDTDENNS